MSDQVWDRTLTNLRELAEARRIEVIELPSFSTEGSLAVEDGLRPAVRDKWGIFEG